MGGLLLLWTALYFGSDRWWVATTAMFAPRWIWAAPMGVLLPAALVLRRRSLLPLAVALLLLLWPIGRLCVPWRPVLASSSEAPALTVRLVTCNTDAVDLRKTSFADLLARENPDVVLLQACRGRSEAVLGAAWHVHRCGDVVLASRYPIAGAQALGLPEHAEFAHGRGWLVVCQLRTPAGLIGVVNIHLNSPRQGLSEVIEQRWSAGPALARNSALRRRQSASARRLIDTVTEPLLIAGDFNTPADGALYREHWSGFSNAFSQAGLGFGHTHFTRWTSIRIDHVLAGPGWVVRSCRVGPDVGSAHRPVIADLELLPSTGR